MVNPTLMVRSPSPPRNIPGKSIKGVLVEYGPGRLLAWTTSFHW
jgi:hypothetical protein